MAPHHQSTLAEEKPLLEESQIEPVGESDKKRKFSPLIITAATLFPFALCLLFFGSSVKPFLFAEVPASVGFCPSPQPLATQAPFSNVWKNFDRQEALDIRSWLYEPEQGLNLTRARDAADRDNVLQLIEAFTPAKQAVLDFADGKAPKPDKYAHVVIQHGAWSTPVIRNYLVGPLPISKSTTMSQIKENYHEPDVPYNARGLFTTSDGRSIGKFLHKIMAPLRHITLDLFGAECTGQPNDSLVAAGSAPVSYDGSWRRMWVPFKLNVPGSWLHSVDFYLYVDMSGDSSDWKVLKVVYNHQIFDTIEGFVKSYEDGTLKRSPKPEHKSNWASRDRQGAMRDLDDRAGPRQVSFDGPRFRVDHEEQYITWMDWSFFLGFENDMGLNFWNIAFKDERLIYELRPQEAMAQYSGNDPHQASTVWLDRSFGMGKNTREMIQGYDCPADALYLPATVHGIFGSTTRENAICVYERDSGKPLTRHTGFVKGEMGATKGYELLVRTISTVGNYDYIFDYTFQLDGSLEVRLSASGYVQGTVWDEEQAEYGHRFRETSMASLHDHVINYKIDWDVAGTANSLLDVTLEMEEVNQPWFDDDWGTRVLQQKFGRKYVDTEDGARLDYKKNGEGAYVIVNKDKTNSWGELRGYAVHPGQSPVHLTNLNCKRTEKNLEWAKHNLCVTKRKENEPDSSSAWNMNLPGKPPVDFSRFFDGDSLDQEDLVMWINVGTHHLVRAEDSPNTLTNAATSSILFSPWNYFDSDVSMESRQSLQLAPSESGQLWEPTGHIKPSFCVPAKAKPVRYKGMLSWEEDGKPSPPTSVFEQRQEAEQIHGLHVVGDS